MPYIETLNSRRARVLIVALVWLLLSPVIYMLILEIAWWTIALLALAAWASLDYVSRGDMFTTADHAASHHIWPSSRDLDDT